MRLILDRRQPDESEEYMLCCNCEVNPILLQRSIFLWVTKPDTRSPRVQCLYCNLRRMIGRDSPNQNDHWPARKRSLNPD